MKGSGAVKVESSLGAAIRRRVVGDLGRRPHPVRGDYLWQIKLNSNNLIKRVFILIQASEQENNALVCFSLLNITYNSALLRSNHLGVITAICVVIISYTSSLYQDCFHGSKYNGLMTAWITSQPEKEECFFDSLYFSGNSIGCIPLSPDF